MGPMRSNVTLSEALRLAYSAFDAGRLRDVEQICQHIVAAKADHFDALHLLAVAQSRLGKKTAALASYDRALAVRPDSAEALCNRAITLHQLERFEEAVATYDRALIVQPDYAEALSNRGNTLRELKRFEEALASYDSALAARPNYADALSNRGNILRDLNRLGEALASYDRALALQPDSALTLSNRGVVLHELERFEEALVSYNRALALQPGFAEVYSNRGNTLSELKRYDEALASYDRALALRPDYVEALSNRANTLRTLKRFEEALAGYDRALAARPRDPEVPFNRGNALHEMRRFEEALASYDRALTMRPHYAEALSNRGNTLQSLRRFEEALASYDRALAARPDYAQALSNRGSVLRDLKRYDEALASYDRAIAIDPDHAEALINRGNILTEMKQFEEALASYARALAVERHSAEAHFNEAICRILIGDLERGFEKYEWRWESRQGKKDKRSFAQPLWLGADDVADKTVLLHAEQGLGDTIQFCRYAPLVAARGARVILEVQDPLRTLMTSLIGPEKIIAKGEPLPAFDMHCPLLSLPLAFRTRLETIPAVTPYLHASPQSIVDWQARLGPARRPAIGLSWSGQTTHPNNPNRAIRLDALSPLLDFDATFVNLQKHVPAGDAALLKERGDILQFGDALRDFSDTAALVANLDLVISVDTSVAHLAGAMGKPVWILLAYAPDWRWLLDRDDSPWYPTARLFRQDASRKWDAVIPRIRAALSDF